MQETVIRGKAAAFVLFAAMIFLSAYFQQQNQIKLLTMQSTGEAEPEMNADAMTKKIAITFDDGPHPSYTKILLDGLRERGVKATFFIIGEYVPGHEDIIRQMAQDGHLIANHTYSHVDISRLSKKEACEELQKTSDLIEEITGMPTAYVRAPFGKWNISLDCEVSMIPIKWTIDPLDWTTKNTAQIVNKVVTNAKEDGIILLHDYYESSVKAALQIIDILTEQNYEFVTVEDLLLE